MKRLILAILLLSAGAALAQTPSSPPAQGEPETVHSSADRLRDQQLSRRFVQSLLRPSYTIEGQFSRWKAPVCPHVVGMAPAAAFVVERRIRDVAAQIGAPLDRRDQCMPNIVVFVTPQPQAMLDAIAAKEILLLAASPLHELKVRYPVQAWYFGTFTDDNGITRMDVDCFYLDETGCPPWVAANDTRLRSGIKAQMSIATILVDSSQIKGMTLGSLGDYLALMSLSQAPATGRCQPAPSITNLFLNSCPADFHTNGLSDADLAMLTALYQTPEEPEKLQMMRLIANMGRNLAAEGPP